MSNTYRNPKTDRHTASAAARAARYEMTADWRNDWHDWEQNDEPRAAVLPFPVPTTQAERVAA